MIPRARLRSVAVRSLVAVAVLLVVSEVGLRVAGVRIHFATVCSWNSGFGCDMWPNLSEDFSVGTPFRVTTNAEGRRDRPRGAKAAGTRRVLVLGDSVTFGVQVSDDQTFPARLEARLGQGIEVINAGSLWLHGTEQQLSYFLDRGVALQPDVVLLEFTARNDFTDNAHRYFWRRGARSLERVEGAPPATWHHRLVLWTAPLAPFRFLDAHSVTWDLIEAGGWHIMHLPRVSAPHEDRTAATEDVLARLDEETRKAGARLIVMIHPSPELVSALRRHDPPRTGRDEAIVTDIARRHHIELLDPTDLIATGPTAADARLDDDDGHLTVRGHTAIADFLAARLGLSGRSVP